MAVLALAIATSQADLYDTKEELDAKYGEPVLAQLRGPYEEFTYKSGDYIIQVQFLLKEHLADDEPKTSVSERHNRADGRILTSAEIKAILTRRPQRGEWHPTGTDTWRLLNIGKARYYSGGALVQSRK